MNDFTFLLDYLQQSATSMTFVSFALNLLGAGITSFLLGIFYTRFGTSLSNRAKLAQSFSALSMTTMLIISIIKSNLALSLGLVGALSIVRFRAAIKEPEELIYLFLSISIGIGFGANQGLITSFAVPFVCAALYFNGLYRRKRESDDGLGSLFLTIQSNNKDLGLATVVDLLQEYCQSADLKRLNRNAEGFEASFIVTFKNIDLLDQCQNQISANKNTKVSIIENTSIFQ